MPEYEEYSRLIDRYLIEREFDRFELLERLRFRVMGIEVTQAVQYFRAASHLTDAADRGADNSVTLIAGKPAWVRVYVRDNFGPTAGVTGSLKLYRRISGIYTSLGTLAPQPPGTVTAYPNPDYATERGTLTRTLNFIIPADQMCGRMRLQVEITAPSGASATKTLTIDVTLRQTLRLAGIMVGYNGPTSSAPGAPNLTLAAPTLADLQTTSAWTLLTFPVRSAATYRSAGTVTWNLPLTDAPSCSGCCSPNWVALNTAVEAQRIADGARTDVLYYGLMAVGIPMGPIIGCNTGTVSTGANGNAVTMAHELGHACGLPHAPCGTGGDPNYPAYEPYDPANTPTASTGEYGLDISNGIIASPALFKDMMAYCGPRWISLYNYGRLTNNADLDPVRTCIDFPWWRDIVLRERFLFPEKWLPDPPPDPPWMNRVTQPERLISVIGVIHDPDRVEVKSVMRCEARRDGVSGRETDLTLELLGEDSAVLAATPLKRLRAYGHDECGCDKDDGNGPRYPAMCQGFLTDMDKGTELRVRAADKVLWSRRAPPQRPQVVTFNATVRKPAGRKEAPVPQVGLEWQVKLAGDMLPECWVQWSPDRGGNWFALTAHLVGKKAILPLTGVPAGEIVLRLLVSDGFYTAESKLVRITVPTVPPEVGVLTPTDGQTLVAGWSMRLHGAVSPPPEPDKKTKVSWLLDGKEVARDLDVYITVPPAGKHRLQLVVAGAGGKAEAQLTFTSVEWSEEEE
jgi:hypothetical protein